MKLSKPNIYEFTDYRFFLKSYFDFEKEKGEFSYSIFALRAGFLARSYLRTVISGKRNLTSTAIEKICVGFNFDIHESSAFRALVLFNQSQKFEEKNHYWEQFLKLKPKKNKSIILDAYNYLSKMAYPILLVILKQTHIRKDLVELSRLTQLSKQQVQDGLETLTQMGTLVKVDDFNFKSNPNNFTTTNDLPNIAIQKFHSNMLSKAIESLDLPVEKREFQSLMVALSEDDFLYLKKRIRNFIDEVEAAFTGPRPKSEKVYSINFNLIPISPDFIRLSKEETSQNSEEQIITPIALEENTL